MLFRKIETLSLFILLIFTLSCSGGGSGSSAPANNVLSTQDTQFNTENASITIASGTFFQDLHLSYSEATAADIGDSTAVSSALVLEFSTPMLTQEDKVIQVSIEVNAEQIQQAISEGKAVYLLRKTEGEGLTLGDDEEDHRLIGWVPRLGVLSEDYSRFSFELNGAVEKATYVVAVGNRIVTHFANLPSSSQSANFIGPQNNAALTKWYQRPWVVICDLGSFDADTRKACDENDADYELTDVIIKLDEVTENYRFEGWEKAKLKTMGVNQIRRLNVQVGPSSLGQELENSEVIYNVAYYYKQIGEGDDRAAGSYDTTTGGLELSQAVLDATRFLAAGDTVGHELFHAIQVAEMPHLFARADFLNYKPLFEATATAMGFWTLAPRDNASLLERRRGPWDRAWVVPFANADRLNPYRAFEFYVEISRGDLDYFHQLFANMPATGAVNADISAALEASTGMGLANSYMMKLLPFRGGESAYQHCDRLFSLTDSGSVSYSDTGLFPLEAMSSQCIYTATQLPADKVVKVSLAERNDAFKLVGLGTSVSGGTAFAFGGKEGRVVSSTQSLCFTGENAVANFHVVNQSLNSSEQTWEARVEIENSCYGLTGLWCAREDLGETMEPCTEYGSFLRLEETESEEVGQASTLSGSAFLYYWEEDGDIELGTRNGNDIVIVVDGVTRPLYPSDDVQWTITYNPDTDEMTGIYPDGRSVIFVRYSNNPHASVPFHDAIF